MIKRELVLFAFVGSASVLLDFLSYLFFIYFKLVEISVAKAIGFLVGTLFAYYANRFWTFGHNALVSGSSWRFALLYTSSLGANVYINKFMLEFLADIEVAFQLAFIIATGISASINFIGMKYFVFNPISKVSIK